MHKESGQALHKIVNPNGQWTYETVLNLTSNQENAC